LAFVNQRGSNLVFTQNSVYLNDKELDSIQISNGSVLGFTPKMSYPIIANKTLEGKITLFNTFTNTASELDITCNDLMSYDGRIYIKSISNIMEIKYTELGTKVLYSTRKVGTCLEKSSTVFPGGVIQNCLDCWVVSVFPKEDTCFQVNLKQLNGYKIVECKYSKKILMVIASISGVYDRFVFKFNEEHSDYSVQKVSDITPSGLNFVVLDNGICVTINEQEKLELFSNDMNNQSAKIVDDDSIHSGQKLYKDGNTVLFAEDNKLFKVKMKMK
jgi:hypothetical protein